MVGFQVPTVVQYLYPVIKIVLVIAFINFRHQFLGSFLDALQSNLSPIKAVSPPSRIPTTPDKPGSHLETSQPVNRSRLANPRSAIRESLNDIQVAPLDMTRADETATKQRQNNVTCLSRLLLQQT